MALGFKEEIDSIDSPTVSKGTERIALAIAVAKQWKVKAIDIKSAFLQGQGIQCDVYLKPPKEANGDKEEIRKLQRSLYEPKDAAHIDDYLHIGDTTFEDTVTSKLCERFIAGKHLYSEVKYTGRQITQYRDHTILDQNEYLEGISPAILSAERARQKTSVLNAEDATRHRSIIGSLNLAWQGTRPDLVFKLTHLSMRFKSCSPWTVANLTDVNKLLQKVHANMCEIMFSNLERVEKWRIDTYAYIANLCNGTASCIGYVVYLGGKNNNLSALMWRAGKSKRICKSTESAEMMALVKGIEESIYVETGITSILSISKAMLPITCITDHRGLWDCIQSTHLTEDWRIRIDVDYVKEGIQKSERSDIRKCSSAQQLVDCLTKRAYGRKLLSVLQKGRLNLDF